MYVIVWFDSFVVATTNQCFVFLLDGYDPRRDLVEWTTHGNRVLATKSEIYPSRLLV